MPKIGAFFSSFNRSEQPDPVLELATLNRELQREIRKLSETNNLQTDSLKKLNAKIEKNQVLVQSQKAQLKVLETTNSELAYFKNLVDYLDDKMVPRVAAVSEVLGYLVDSAVDIAERKRNDEPLKTKVQTLEADLTRIKNQRNVLVVTLTALVAGSVFFCLKK